MKEVFRVVSEEYESLRSVVKSHEPPVKFVILVVVFCELCVCARVRVGARVRVRVCVCVHFFSVICLVFPYE